MNISKTLFKNLSRCHNFMALYDLYINRSFHDIKAINTKKKSTEIMKDIFLLNNNLFDKKKEKIEELLSEMFDENTGEDLLNLKSDQLEAFASTFTEVERLASLYIEQVFKQPVLAAVNTYEQKKYAYKEEGNTFYCYLDCYFEDEKNIQIFEVKATTSKKFDDFGITINKKHYDFFTFNNGIMEYQDLTTKFTGKDQEKVKQKVQTLLDKFSDCGKYIYDISVERHIIENSLKKVGALHKNISYYLVVLNANYTFSGVYKEGAPCYDIDKNGEALFKIYDMDFLTSAYQPLIENEKKEIIKNSQFLTLEDSILGKCCEYKKTTACKFHKICMKEVLQDGSILEYFKKQYAFSIPTIYPKKRQYLDVYDLINQGYHKIDDVRPYLTKMDNIVQYECYVNQKIYIDLVRINKALEGISYPIYYLDFESYNSPLPRFKGEHPYTQSLFQYSLHLEKEPNICDLVKDHHEFLAKDHYDHRLELIEHLIQDIDLTKGGSVIVYNKSFEKTRLKELSYIFPQYKKELDDINNHIFDLLEVLKGTKNLDKLPNHPSFTYYNNKMHGSFSIKKVLPLFSNLSYNDLEVKNGTEAILAYGMLPYYTKKEYEEKYLALSFYCRQDTWAMVEILKGLRQMIDKKINLND